MDLLGEVSSTVVVEHPRLSRCVRPTWVTNEPARAESVSQPAMPSDEGELGRLAGAEAIVAVADRKP